MHAQLTADDATRLTLGDLITPKKHINFIVIGQIIGLGKISSFWSMELILASVGFRLCSLDLQIIVINSGAQNDVLP